MCTLTFIPKPNDGFILTSNRDEAPERDTIPPQLYKEEGVQLLYPKDAVAGGTWLGVSAKQRVVCLLNGGFEPHERKDDYRMSRGVIVKDVLVSSDAMQTLKEYNFKGIEPFTLVWADWQEQLHLYECVWDEVKAHFSEKPIAPQIWSSSLLYTQEMKQKREDWFSSFLFENLKPTPHELWEFHHTAGEGSSHFDLVMDRNFVTTKSITQIVKKDAVRMKYKDLHSDVDKTIELP
ncbi:NRDE family protein [Flavobacteriaceae bacterium TK19130]|nr:NRDE family protein [Thermobacterium salinum]